MKYISIEVETSQYKKDSDYEHEIVDVRQIDEDEIVKTEYGELLIKAGMYIVTDSEGRISGMPELELNRRYKPFEQ